MTRTAARSVSVRPRARRADELYLTDLFIAVTIVLVTFRGFIENFIGHGTVFVDFCFGLLLVWGVMVCLCGEIGRSRHKKVLQLYLVWTAMCAAVGILQVVFGKTTFYNAVIGFRNNNVYTGLFLIAALRLSMQGVKRCYKLFVNCGIVICLFAIAQYVLRDVLPERFLVLNGEDVFTLFGSDIIRVTGLMGNTIIFGGYAIILFSLVWAELMVRRFRPLRLWLKLLVIAAANYLTFSRASVAGMVAVLFLEFIIYGCSHGQAAKYLAVAGMVVLVVFLLALTVFRNTIIVQRVFGLNSAWTSASDEGHFDMIGDAMEMIGGNWLIGTMLGHSSDVVTDGAFWAYLMEMGIPAFLTYCVLLLVMCVTALKNCRSRNAYACTVNIGYIGMNAYLLAFSFINSAYMARSVLIFVWLIGGMVLAASPAGEQGARKRVAAREAV